MKTKRLFSIFILSVLLNSFIFSQDWRLINPDRKYNYTKNGESFISSTIWVDSVKSEQEGDSTFYLNRIVIDCDTCETFEYNNIPIYAFYNQPQFLQKTVTITDSNYTFKFPGKFIIYSKANLGFSWVFDSLKNITASIVDKSEQQIFDLNDSIKTIGLSTGDTIIISKNYGIIRFDSIYKSNLYNLAGINNQIGDSVPDFFDFFNFSVGDIFEYHGNYTDIDVSPPADFIRKVFIKSKSIFKDSIVYNVHIKEYESRIYTYPQPLLNTYKRSYDTKWIFINSINHPSNRYNNELIQFSEIIENYYISDEYPIDYTFLRCYVDTNKIYTKSLGSFDNNDYMFIFDSSLFILERPNNYPREWNELRYKVGLGEVYYYNQGFEFYSMKELIAYTTANDTVGEFTDDSYFSALQESELDNSFTIYPNPAKDIVYINSMHGQLIDEISIIGLNGAVYRKAENSNNLSLEGLEPSVYIVKIVLGKKVARIKVVKL